MRPAFRNLLYALVVLLLLANMYTLYRFWMHRGNVKPFHPRDIQAYLVRELSLDPGQAARYDEMVQQHRKASDSLRRAVRSAKEEMFRHLRNEQVGDDLVEQSARRAAALSTELDMRTMAHFRDIRKLCRPDQQERFDALLMEVARMMSAPPPPGPGGPAGFPPPPR
jgi:protein CpxP